MFKLFVEGKELDIDKAQYFELVKGSVIGSDIGTINREYSTNITLPITQTNVAVFKAHKLWGGTSKFFKGVAHFGFEAFECLVQLVEFDDKKIVIYVVRSSDAVSDFLEGDFNAIIESSNYEHYSYIPNQEFPPTGIEEILSLINEKTPFTIGVSGTQRVNFRAVLQDSKFGGLVDLNSFDSTQPIFYLKKTQIPEQMTKCLNITWTYNTLANLLGGADNTLGGQHSINGMGGGMELTQFDVDKGVKLYFAVEVESAEPNLYAYSFCDVALINHKTNEVRNIMRLDQLIIHHGGEYQTSLSEVGYWRLIVRNKTTAIIDLQINRAVTVRVSDWAHYNPDLGTPQFFLPHTGASLGRYKVVDIFKSLAVENGKYIAISRGGQIVFRDFPSLDFGDIVDVSHFYKSYKKTSLKHTSPMTAVNNYIKYPEDANGSYSYINVKIDDNRIYAPLSEESVLFELKHFRGQTAMLNSSTDEHPTARGTTPILSDSLSKFRIFRDTFNNVILYQIEFKGMFDVPESILYIEQLNGLFLPEKIIKTSKNVLILNCYKIEKQ